MKGVILANRKTIFHKTRVCPRMSLGACHLGSKCNFAHSVEELRPAPNLDKTKLCPSVLHPGTVCPAKARGEVCRFAHSKAEIRHTSNMFKTNMCLKWIRGKCKKDLQCNHAHGHQELKYYRSLAMASGSRDFARESEATLSRRKKQNAATPPVGPSLAGLGEIFNTGQQPQQRQRQWSDTCRYTDSANSRDHLLSLLARTAAAQQQSTRNNSCTSVNVALAALYEDLLRCKTRSDAYGPRGNALGASFQDDSTTATDECSDFSSFSSRCLSDALRSAASTAASCGGPLQPAELDSVLVPASSAASTSSISFNSNSSDLSLDVDRLLFKMLAEDGAGVTDCSTSPEGQPQLHRRDSASPAASVLITGRETEITAVTNRGLEALGSGLARLCLTDPSVRRHCYAEPPPGFEGRCHQQQQHAVIDLDRLASSEGLD